MMTILLWIVTALYVGQAGMFAWYGMPWLGLIYFAYALANVG